MNFRKKFVMVFFMPQVITVQKKADAMTASMSKF